MTNSTRQSPPLFCLGFFLVTLFGQAQVTDAFTDGNFSTNPRWEGDTSCFTVNADNQLQSGGTGADTAILATPNQLLQDTEWNAWIQLSFNTSANNHGRIYLNADKPELDQPLNGYFIQIGGSTDSICFMKQTGTTIQSLFCFPDYLTNQSVNTVRIKLRRDHSGRWDGWLDPHGGTSYLFQGTVSDNTFTTSQWFGFYCRYTSSNATRFYMDDIYVGPEKRDTIPPRIMQVAFVDSIRLSLLFSEIPEASSALNTQHYLTLRDNKHPGLVEKDVTIGQRVILTFTDPFPDQSMDSLHISGILDNAGNQMDDTIVPFARFEPGTWDILIHEIMIDPDPPVGLPVTEYVELINTTAFPVNMEGWRLDISSSQKTFPAVTIPPSGFLLVAKDLALMPYGVVVPLLTASSSLSNGGDQLTLRDAQNRIIHSVGYDPGWGTASWKQEGGWSLEMKDCSNPCGCNENWDFSEDVSGGTPGRRNSIEQAEPDHQSPSLMRSYLADFLSWELLFPESLDTLSVGSPADWLAEPGIGTPVRIDPVEPDYTHLRLLFSTPFSTGIVYTLTSTAKPSDCAGNIVTETLETRAAFPEPMECNDLLVNEILFDPFPYSSRFIELYNQSEKIIDLASVGLLAANTGSDFDWPELKPVSQKPYILFPFDYVAVCDETDLVKSTYHTPFPNRMITTESFPALNSTRGQLALIRLHDEEVIDQMDYDTEMHYPLLSSTEGVSLERISPGRPSAEPTNWHSASSQSGFATPAYQNSQWKTETAADDCVHLDPRIFSPDNDGRDDVTGISCSFGEGGGQVSVSIYSPSGRKVRQLASNVLIGSTGTFTWDGTDDAGNKVNIGIYLVFLEYLHPEGRVERIRKPVVVATNL